MGLAANPGLCVHSVYLVLVVCSLWMHTGPVGWENIADLKYIRFNASAGTAGPTASYN